MLPRSRSELGSRHRASPEGQAAEDVSVVGRLFIYAIRFSADSQRPVYDRKRTPLH